jgi:Fe-S oxidoreductase
MEPLGLRVALEPGCTASVYMGMLRDIAEGLGCTVVGGSTGCCGKGSKVSGDLMRERQEECSGADVIIVGCPMCFIKYDRYPDGPPVMHVSELVAYALGDRSTLEHHLKRM